MIKKNNTEDEMSETVFKCPGCNQSIKYSYHREIKITCAWCGMKSHIKEGRILKRERENTKEKVINKGVKTAKISLRDSRTEYTRDSQRDRLCKIKYIRLSNPVIWKVDLQSHPGPSNLSVTNFHKYYFKLICNVVWSHWERTDKFDMRVGSFEKAVADPEDWKEILRYGYEHLLSFYYSIEAKKIVELQWILESADDYIWNQPDTNPIIQEMVGYYTEQLSNICKDDFNTWLLKEIKKASEIYCELDEWDEWNAGLHNTLDRNEITDPDLLESWDDGAIGEYGREGLESYKRYGVFPPSEIDSTHDKFLADYEKIHEKYIPNY